MGVEQRGAGRWIRERHGFENKPAAVPEKAKQAGEIWGRWPWVEPEVWTDRMLTALEKGVKGGKWFSLIDKVYAMSTLQRAFTHVKVNGGRPGVDHQTIEMFENRLQENLKKLSQEVRDGVYRPRAIKRVYIPKPGSTETRPLGIPTVRDRVVQAALKMVLEPIFELDFAMHSYGFRPGRGCKDALRRVDELLKGGYIWVVDADLKSYFDTIPHNGLLGLVRDRVSDGRVLKLIEGRETGQANYTIRSQALPGTATRETLFLFCMVKGVLESARDIQKKRGT